MRDRTPISARPPFTLIELLAVVAVLALLSALLLPMLENARDRAITMHCLSNLRQQAGGMLLYCSDNDGVFKSSTDGVGGFNNGPIGNWYTVMNTYVENNAVWTCPGVPKGVYGTRHSALNPLLDLADVSGWVFNGVTYRSGRKYVQVTMVPTPSTTGMFFERIGPYAAPDLDQSWYCGGPPPQILPNWNTDYGCWPMHAKNVVLSATFSVAGRNQTWYWPRDTNVVRVDGSARTYPWIDLKQGVVPPLSVVPAGYSGFQAPRAYLITGYRPKTNGGGWLND